MCSKECIRKCVVSIYHFSISFYFSSFHLLPSIQTQPIMVFWAYLFSNCRSSLVCYDEGQDQISETSIELQLCLFKAKKKKKEKGRKTEMHTWWAEEVVPKINPSRKSALLIVYAPTRSLVVIRKRVTEIILILMMVVDVEMFSIYDHDPTCFKFYSNLAKFY